MRHFAHQKSTETEEIGVYLYNASYYKDTTTICHNQLQKELTQMAKKHNYESNENDSAVSQDETPIGDTVEGEGFDPMGDADETSPEKTKPKQPRHTRHPALKRTVTYTHVVFIDPKNAVSAFEAMNDIEASALAEPLPEGVTVSVSEVKGPINI